MKHLLPLALTLLLPLPMPAQEAESAAPQTEAATATDSHTELAEAMVDFLRRTDECLATCTDEDTARAAVPQLESLRAEAESLASRQAALPEPTVQDYMATQDKANDFLQYWQSIRAHLARMEKDGLLLPEIRKVLHIAPETSGPSE